MKIERNHKKQAFSGALTMTKTYQGYRPHSLHHKGRNHLKFFIYSMQQGKYSHTIILFLTTKLVIYEYGMGNIRLDVRISYFKHLQEKVY